MKRRRHTPEQIIRKLREADRLLAEGQEVPEVAKPLEVSRGDLSPLARPVRRAEGRRRQAAEGAGGRERPAEADRGRQGAPDRGLEGARAGKLVSPARRRRAVEHLQQVFGVSQRWACQLVGQHRSTQRHQPAEPDRDRALRPSCASSAGPIRGGVIVARTPSSRSRAGGQPQGRPAAVARGRPARAGQAAQAPAAGHLHRAGRPAGGRAPRTMCGRWTTSSTRPTTAGG